MFIIIKKCKAGYRVYDSTGKRNLGTYKTMDAAKHRLAQIEALKAKRKG